MKEESPAADTAAPEQLAAPVPLAEKATDALDQEIERDFENIGDLLGECEESVPSTLAVYSPVEELPPQEPEVDASQRLVPPLPTPGTNQSAARDAMPEPSSLPEAPVPAPSRKGSRTEDEMALHEPESRPPPALSVQATTARARRVFNARQNGTYLVSEELRQQWQDTSPGGGRDKLMAQFEKLGYDRDWLSIYILYS